MQIGIIGAGKVGTTIGKYLQEHEIPVTGYYSRTKESAAQAAAFTGTDVFPDLEALTEASDTLFIATPDGEIRKVWDCIAGLSLSGKIIGHFSGSLSSHVFSGIEKTGAFGVSIHPMYAFSDKFTAYRQFYTAILVAEGEKEALEQMRLLFQEKLGHQVLTIHEKDKMKYHAAATLASNAMLALFYQSQQLLAECGFSEMQSRELLVPLVTNNIRSMLEQGTVAALTGPVERNDIKTVQAHLEATGGRSTVEENRTYRELGKTLVTMAEKKHPDRDYTDLKNVFFGRNPVIDAETSQRAMARRNEVRAKEV